MSLFKKIFKKEDKNSDKSKKKGFYEVIISSINHLTEDSIQLSFDISSELKSKFTFIPGQYINVCFIIEGIEEIRSYSICSGRNENLSIGVKKVNNGKISNWIHDKLSVGDKISISTPEGNFILKENEKNSVAFAAGSGITPIISIAKEIEISNKNMHLFYGNKTEKNIFFKKELLNFKNVKTEFYLSQEKNEKYNFGKLTKESINLLIKQNLELLKSDVFLICGPEQMIVTISEILVTFGMPKDKIRFELFTAPVLLKGEDTELNEFNGNSKVKVILDEEVIEFTLKSEGKTILETLINDGYDPPYSCRGAVCCTCKAKIIKGKASMKMNYSLSKQDVDEGYILTCQAHPASDELVISYDAK